jgi:hypothetical protein
MNLLHTKASGFRKMNRKQKCACYTKQLLQSQGPLKKCKLHQTDHQAEYAYLKFDVSSQLQIQQLTTRNVLHRHLHLRAYNIHLLKTLKLYD